MNSVEPSSPNSQLDVRSPVASSAELLAFGREDRDAAGHGGEHVAVLVDGQAVARARCFACEFAGVEELAAFAERAVGLHRKRHDDRPRAVRIGDVQRFLIRRKAMPFGRSSSLVSSVSLPSGAMR